MTNPRWWAAVAMSLALACSGSGSGEVQKLLAVAVVPVTALALAPTNEVGSADPLDGATQLRVTVSGAGMSDESAVYRLDAGDAFSLPDFPEGYSRQVSIEFCGEDCDPLSAGDILSRGRSGLFTVFGGDSRKDLTVFVSRRNSLSLPAHRDPDGSGTAVPSTMIQHNRVGATVTALDDGRLLIVGGAKPKLSSKTWWKSEDLEEIYPSAEVFDPCTGEFSAVNDLNLPRAFHQAVKLGGPNKPDGRVVILGGYTTGNKVTPAIEIFDPASDSFELVAENQYLAGGAGRALFTAGLAYPDDDVLFIAGGFSNYAQASATWDLYLVGVGTVAHGNLAAGARWNHSMSYVPNYGGTGDPAFLLFGGENSTDVVSKVEPFVAKPNLDKRFSNNFVADESAQPDLPYGGRTLLQSVSVPSQKIIYVIGGFAGKDLAGPSNRVDPYWVGDRNFREGQYLTMSTPRGAMSATLMNYTAILIAGGIGDNGALSSTELIFEDTLCDPPGSSNCFYTPKVAGGLTPILVDASGAAQARAGMTALFDETQRVLLFGGLSGTGSDLPALYFNPD